MSLIYADSSVGRDRHRASRHKRFQSFKRPWSRKRKVVTAVLSVAVIFLGLFGWFGSRLVGSLDKVFHGNIFSDVQALFSKNNLNESDGRINILVAGDSSDDPGHAGADLTDSIMLLSIDPNNHTGFMLSIPRDLWVYVPGLKSYQKINAANTVTNFSQPGYPNGGMGQLQEIVQNDLGISVDYYALVNYAAFKDAVDAVDGITVDVNSPDSYGLYDSFTNLKLPNGEDNLDGQEALNLARARCDAGSGDICYGFPNSDFTRTMYQREMVVAILKKATSIGVISNPLKVTSLFSSFANNVQTNLSLQDVLSLDQAVKGINFSSLGSYAYSSSVAGDSNPLLVGYIDPASGQDGLIPSAGIGNYSGLRAYFLGLTSSNPVAKEDASIEVLNGTNVSGLAKQEQLVLESKDIANVSIGDTLGNYTPTLIVDNSNGKDPNTKSLLESIFTGTLVSSDTGSAEAKEAAQYSSDSFVVILGQNFANTHPVGSSTSSFSSTGSVTGSSSSTN